MRLPNCQVMLTVERVYLKNTLIIQFLSWNLGRCHEVLTVKNHYL